MKNKKEKELKLQDQPRKILLELIENLYDKYHKEYPYESVDFLLEILSGETKIKPFKKMTDKELIGEIKKIAEDQEYNITKELNDILSFREEFAKFNQ